MSPTETLATTASKVDTGLTDSTHSSWTSSTSSSAERYRLNESDERPILLYNYRAAKDKLKTSSEKDLCAMLDKDERLRVTKKQIPRLSSYVDVKRHDLFLPDEKEQYSTVPNYDSSLASVKVPSAAYWGRLLFGSYDQLYIVSPEHSPSSSVADSDSRHLSPASTWGYNSETVAAHAPEH